jgi:hypothetical protein
VLLREGLDSLSTAALRRLASVHGLVHDDGTTPAELVERLHQRLLDSAYLDQQLSQLSEAERATLIGARGSGGELRGLLIDRDFPGVSDALVERGLLFRIFAVAGPLRGEVFAAPEEFLARLPSPAAIGGPPTGEPPPADRRASDPAFSLFALVSALERSGADLEKDVREWSEEPGGWDWDARWEFLRHLGQTAGLLARRADGGLGRGPSLRRLLDDPPALAERLWRAYVHDRGWSEVDRGLPGHDHGQEFADTLGLRQALVDLVQALPVGEWISFEAFSSWVQRARPAAIREQLNTRGLVALDAAGWADLEVPLLRYALLGPLYWLGVIGASADGRHIVRRGGRPATARGEQAPSTGSTVEACEWEGAELVAPARAQLGTLLDAERYLVLRERGRPSRYHLVQAHVAAALAGGGSIGECRRLLARLTRADLPAAIDARLEEWQARFGALGVRPAVLVEARSAAELDAAIAEDGVRPLIRARLSPTVVEVPAADVLELAAALRASGHLPRIDAALRLAAEPRRAYTGLVDEQVLEFLLVALLAFSAARPAVLDELEGATSLLERLERQFPPERLAALRATAARIAGDLSASPPARPTPRPPRRPRRKQPG